jgi:hypothetical protein
MIFINPRPAPPRKRDRIRECAMTMRRDETGRAMRGKRGDRPAIRAKGYSGVCASPQANFRFDDGRHRPRYRLRVPGAPGSLGR